MISQESKNAASYSTAKKSQVPFRLGKGGKEKEEREKRKGREEKKRKRKRKGGRERARDRTTLGSNQCPESEKS